MMQTSNSPNLSNTPSSDGDGSGEYREAISYLENRVNYENYRQIPYEELGSRLARMRSILDFLGKPDDNYSVIHVAGTKGKGSTCIIFEQVLVNSGFKVGRFCSPHLHSLMERFVIDGVPCSQDRFADILLSIRNRLESWTDPDGNLSLDSFPLTYFELTTIFAMEYFAQENVDFAVFEVGLGGRLDSTNICKPDITIITSISFDHLEQLGPTLSDIAREKAGIIKPGIPIISGVRNDSAHEAIKETAAANDAPLYEIETDFCLRNGDSDSKSYDFSTLSPNFAEKVEITNLPSPVLGEHQIRNAALVLAGVMLLREKGRIITDESIRSGLRSVELPARVEVLQQQPTIIVDGAHNRASVRELIETIDKNFPLRKRFLIFGSMLGKDVEGMLLELVPSFDWTVFTQPPHSLRCFPARGLIMIAQSLIADDSETFNTMIGSNLDGNSFNIDSSFGEVIPELDEAFAKVSRLAGKDDLICATGSFYLAARIRELVLGLE